MLFSRVLSFFAFAATFGSLAVARAVPEKRDIASIQQTVSNLKSTTDTIVSEIQGLIANKNATDATVAPLMSELITAIYNASNATASSAPPALVKRQDISGIANELTSVITAVTGMLQSLAPELSGIPVVGSLVPELGGALTSLLSGLSLVTGLLSTVLGLLGPVTGILGGLGFLGGILGLLGGL
ncbi:uncharacterized protein FOMMEDRAFT_145830 [Fomitiporia mediterranea MF3/22]|uniref:uncharacterized protein n=1 Tax=Fomitiporia mediterranea (strain MF3/22) TaxID=694068 RepID=UPI00044095D9|nr:uncharacterized protein FOMMEDRAFT_145830 [Fomitiporia mediterranea MF3/22]EJD03534.1 hypothetical protein FOMMEDRAFT_145830 [Fomitiporia mediterranea MF3/22]